MSEPPQEAVDAAAMALHQRCSHKHEGVCDPCQPSAYDRALARAALKAAEEAWPHTPPRRDPAPVTHGDFGKRGEPVTHQQPGRYQAHDGRPFGFGPPEVTA